MSRAMSGKFQKLLGDLTVQYMMDVQELRDEVIKLKSENDCLKETNEYSEPAVQGSCPLEGQTSVQAKQPIYQQQPEQQHKQQQQEQEQQLQEQEQQVYKSEAVYRSQDYACTEVVGGIAGSAFSRAVSASSESSHQSHAGRRRRSSSRSNRSSMSKEDILIARLYRAQPNELDPMGHLTEENAEIPAAEVHHCTRIANFLRSDAYELMVGFIILVNLFAMAAVFQVEGHDLGHSIGYPGYSESSRGSQMASEVFDGLDLLFLCFFTVDLILRTSVLHLRFFKAPLNWVDLLVVISGFIEIFGHRFMDPFYCRMLRLVKFGRALRAMQLSKVSHSLKLLGKCIRASVGMLFWSLCLLFIIQCIAGMMLSSLVDPFMKNTEIDPHVRRLVFRYYGTFSGSMLTMFEVLFANWPTPCRILVDNVSEWFGLWFIIYRCLVGFAVLNVVQACFVQQTMSVAQQDTELMIEVKEKTKNAYARKLSILFRELDTSGDGILSWEEFAVLLTDDRLRSFLSAMEIDASDLKGLFDVLGDGSGNISADDFIAGATSWNGFAKAADMAQLLSIAKRLDSKLEASASCSQQLVLQAELAVDIRRYNNNHNNDNDNDNNSAHLEPHNTSAFVAESKKLVRFSPPFRCIEDCL
ncbi:unnamed protein product [Polarella glacialis]|uniref:EF-hand domain-containing protein n=1 Tax=Polarella glacialis TaxID=89957 RepID=A0A813L4Z1_POLGL|nr:unnamed protein product [Polarella glacialis]